MNRCQAITVNGKRCKNVESCFIHKQDICNICKEIVKCKYKLDCGHIFCKHCLAIDIYEYQWFDDFSTDHPLRCPECDKCFIDYDWSNITDYLVEIKKLQRKIVYTSYLNKEWTNKLCNYIIIGNEYSSSERDIIETKWEIENKIPLYRLVYPDEIPSKVYFVKYKSSIGNLINFYTFEIDYQKISGENKIDQKEIVEYMFHPNRIGRNLFR